MNPDSGRIHELATDEAGRDLIKAASGAVAPRNKKEGETVEEKLKRAEARARALLPDSEPPPGTEVPDDWPRFSVGDEIPWKGWFFRVEFVDVEEQRVVIKPLRPTRSTLERRGGKKPRKKRRKGGRR
jgi:hypothetical protein